MSFQPAPWPLPDAVCAGWTTREDGLSEGAFNSFNLALHVGDDDERVMQNRQKLKSELVGQPDIVWLNQTHSAVVVEAAMADKNCGQDGSYSQQVNQACCVMTADCLPVFFWDEKGEQVAIAHAGWRGLADGILAETLATFPEPNLVNIGIGPAISQRCFEVGEDVVEAFSNWPNKDEFFTARSVAGKFDCDLAGLAETQMRQLGVQTVYQSGLCSYERADQLYSYRRDGKTGRMANLIWKIA